MDAVGPGAAPFIVIPDAAAAYSCSACDAAQLTAHLLDEIEPAVAHVAGIEMDPNRRAIGGISRGGGYALRIAGREPASFVAVGGHSSVPAGDEALDAIAASSMPVDLDVGTGDSLADGTVSMADHLERTDGDVTLAIGDGSHDRSYWRSHMFDYVSFYGGQLQRS